MSKLDIQSKLNFNKEYLSALYVELFGIIDISKTNQSNLIVINNFLKRIVNILDQNIKFLENN